MILNDECDGAGASIKNDTDTDLETDSLLNDDGSGEGEGEEMVELRTSTKGKKGRNQVDSSSTPPSSSSSAYPADVHVELKTLNADGEGEDDEDSVALLEVSEESRLREVYGHCGRLMGMGISGGVLLGVEFWHLDVLVYFTSFLGNVSLDACAILASIGLLMHIGGTVPLAGATSSRVMAALAKGSSSEARRASRVGLLMGALFGIFSTALMLFLGYAGGPLFTSDSDVADRMRDIAYIAVCCHILNVLQGTLQGPLRGMGRFLECTSSSIVTRWIVGIPTAYYLCFECRPRFGLEGIWLGATAGNFFMSVLLVALLYSASWKQEVLRAEVASTRSTADVDDVHILAAPGALNMGSVSLASLLNAEERELEEMEFELDHGEPDFDGAYNPLAMRDADASDED
jgi:hypothetical protein